jgi:glycosyltransferase involved in cell wall biosynthesis
MFNQAQDNRAQTSSHPMLGAMGVAESEFSHPVGAGPVPRGRLVAVIPAYNEDRFIGSVVLKARAYVDQVIVFDDGSTDQTAQVAREAGATVVQLDRNQGKARALEVGFAHALGTGADVVVVLDSDGQHNPGEIPLVVAPIQRDEADMVIGSRFLGTRNKIPLWRQFGQHALTFATNVSSGVPTTDSQSGFRAFRRDALNTLHISGKGFSIESEMQFWAREHSLRVSEAPISVVYVEKAKRNPVTQALQVLNGILALVSQMRPLLIFGASGLLVALVGSFLWYRTVTAYEATRELALGHALLGTLFMILGILTMFQGLTLHVLRYVVLGRQPKPAGSHTTQGDPKLRL